MKLFSAVNEVSMSGIWVFFFVLVAAIIILMLWQLRHNLQHARQHRDLYDSISTLTQWYATQGENLEFLKTRLPGVPSYLPNAAHTPEMERAVCMMMSAGVMRPQAYELLYKALDRGKHPEAFAAKFVDLSEKVTNHAPIH